MKLQELFENRKVKRHTKFGDLDLSIEIPSGSYRSGVDNNGNSWSQKMKCHYGYIKMTGAPDGDNLDCFLRVNPKDNSKVYVIHQLDKTGKEYDEDKVMLGFSDKDQAKHFWSVHSPKPRKMFGGMSTFELEHFCSIIHPLRNSCAMIANKEIFNDLNSKNVVQSYVQSPQKVLKNLKESRQNNIISKIFE